jgi:UDP-N-acetylglucosamine--N-acetylmuramyl-(pentapeptide) pyrophosphoryl-undecaprenol N-acetylglucosamine transferase
MGVRVMVMAGGTGGHVFPALVVARDLAARGAAVVWLGSAGGFESQVVPAAGIPTEWIQVRGLRGHGWRWAIAPFSLARALWQALGAIRRVRPQVVLGMGGFVTGPGGLGARLLGIPLVIHEQNAIPGMTNRWLARWATRVAEAFPGSFAGRQAVLTGNPVRPEIATLPVPAQRWMGRDGPLRLLVLGGSQGAQALNQTVPAALGRLAPERRPAVRHQAGRDKVEATRAAYRQAGVEAEVVEFIAAMAEAYAWADLAVCRAGAITLAELAAAGLGAVLVPYPYAVDDHQTHNAEYFVRAGAAERIPQGELDAERLARTLARLLDVPGRLLAMAEAARVLARPGAAAEVAGICLEVGR